MYSFYDAMNPEGCVLLPLPPALYIDKGTEKQQDETVCFNIETAGKLEIGFVPGP